MDTQVQNFRGLRSAPLSFAQQRLWFIEQMFPGQSVYNIPAVLRLTGELNIAALRQSIQEIVRRHGSLRTTFSDVDGKPRQLVHPPSALPFPLIDLRALSAGHRDTEVLRLTQHAAGISFDLTAGPVLRVALLWVGPGEYVLSLTMHHIVSDGWSLGLLIRELASLYLAFTAGKPSPLAELPMQYTDFAVWQRRRVSGKRLEDQLAYWKRQLEGAPPVLELPADRPGSATDSFRGAHQTFELSPELSESLRCLSRANGVTLFMTLLAAFQTLLARYVNQPDIVVGVPIANRTRTEMEALVGFFVNSLVMRTVTSGDPAFRQLLERVRKVALEAYAHQDIPFEKLVDELQVQRSLNNTPLFQVMFALQNAPQASLELPGLKFEQIHIETGTTKFDLTLQMEEAGPVIRGSVGYKTDLFDHATIELLIDHLHELLKSIVREPDQRLSELSIVGQRERERLLGQPVEELPVTECLHEWFTRQASRTPDAIAVSDDSAQLTYAELDRSTNQLANYLRRLGVGPECIVALYLPRSLPGIEAILAVLKAGGAYLPLDASSPAARIRQVLEDSGALVVLSETGAEPELASIRTPVIGLETERERLAKEAADPPAPGATPQNLAYVIYTSGSTGKPKGVLITHENVARLMKRTEHWYQPNETDVWSMFFSYAFDFSVWEMWGALLYGGRLVIVPYWTSRSSESLYELLVANQVTFLNQTPSAFRQLIEVDKTYARGKLALRYVIFGGEALEAQSLSDWFGRHGDEQPQIVNMYGITETTVHVTYRPIKKADALFDGPTSIGIPIPDLQLYLLDGAGQLTPLTVSGEIHVGGVGLARGYLNQPELTSQRFIPDLFGPRPGARLYKSGDLARYSADGEMRYLGRGDDQVKIRGFRIELGEIKSALEQHPGVREAAVVVSAAGEKRLMAYLVPESQREINETVLIADVRNFIKGRVTDYMIPAAFVVLESMPLTVNGKLDRKALPAPSHHTPSVAEGIHFAPRTAIEKRLAEIWGEVLGIQGVGFLDNFFELGGDSILSIQVVARAKTAGIRITPKQMFQYQTIAELAEVAALVAPSVPAAETVSGTVPLTAIQEWFCEHVTVEPGHFNQSVLLRVDPEVDPALLENALRHVVSHHDTLRLRFVLNRAGWSQAYVDFVEPLILKRVSLAGLDPAAQTTAIQTEATALQSSLDISAGPVVRAAYFDLGPNVPGRLFLVIHHLVVDGVSWRVLLDDLQLAYSQLVRAEPVVLPAKSASYKQWSERLRQYVAADDVAAEVDYWMADRWLQATPLPLDQPLGENTVDSARRVLASLSAEETRQLLQDATVSLHASLPELLLAAFLQALARWTGGESFLIDMEGHGREDLFDEIDVSRTVGWFTSIYPVLLNATTSGSAVEILKNVKTSIRAVPQKGIGYGLLRYLGPAAIAGQLRKLPQPEISFNYLGQFDQLLSKASLFEWAGEPTGPAHSPAGKRTHVLDVSSYLIDGRLQISLSFSEHLHERQTIEKLAADLLMSLRLMIAQRGAYVPADFPLAQIGQRELDWIAAGGDLEDVYPLTPLQHGMLFLNLYEQDLDVYFQQFRCTIRGNLDLSSFAHAWQQLLDRHACLRSSFEWERLDEPLQIVRTRVPTPLVVHDWRDLSPAVQEDRLESFIANDRLQAFNLSRAPLMRLTLVRLDDDTFEFLWSHHHLQVDGWSFALVMKEFFLLYDADRRGNPNPLPPRGSYRDYIAWLRRQDESAAEQYWRRILSGFRGMATIGTTSSASDVNSPGSALYEQEIRLTEELSSGLRQLARQCEVTLNTLLQGAWALLLSHATGEEDVVFGSVVSGRPPELPNVGTTVGLFINTLPVRVQIAPDVSLSTWLKQLQARQAEAREYEYSSLAQIQRWTEVLPGKALFESILIFQNYPVDSSLRLEQIDLSVLKYRSYDKTNYPLGLLVAPGSRTLLQLKYNSRRFTPDAIEKLLNQLRTLLEDMVQHPGKDVKFFSVSEVEETRELIGAFNDELA
jgi:amino acid adenylation domain-containing protein/non-ribosomal peptide synthase protein (TIGR01720 family)